MVGLVNVDHRSVSNGGDDNVRWEGKTRVEGAHAKDNLDRVARFKRLGGVAE